MTESTKRLIKPSGVERFFREDEVIVSKTDLKGRLTYVNRVFINLSGYQESELLGEPHSLIRHPDMPRSVFKLLWDTLGAGREIFAYVVNMSKNGDHYWVLAHVTPCYDMNGKLIGYHSNRRSPRSEALAIIRPLYSTLLQIEQKNGRKEGLEASEKFLNEMLESKKTTYDEFILNI